MWRVQYPGDWVVIIEELVLVEQYFGVDDPEELRRRYSAGIEALDTAEVEGWFRDAHRKGLPDDALTNFRDNWLEGAKLGGVAGEHVADEIRQGFVTALSAARASEKKLSVVSVLGETGPDAFGVRHIEGPNAVTVVIRIPADASPPAQPATS
jgi:hypothetical protein